MTVPLESIAEENEEDALGMAAAEVASDGDTVGEKDLVPYKEVRSKEGRLARVCQGNVTCPKNGHLYYKIDRLRTHLQEFHGYNGPIKFGQNGRPPKGEEVEKSNNADIYLKQRQKCFLMANRMFSLAVVEHEKRLTSRSTFAWDMKLSDVERSSFTNVEEYVNECVKSGLATYMAEKDAKMAKKQARISKGWEENRRLKKDGAVQKNVMPLEEAEANAGLAELDISSVNAPPMSTKEAMEESVSEEGPIDAKEGVTPEEKSSASTATEGASSKMGTSSLNECNRRTKQHIRRRQSSTPTTVVIVLSPQASPINVVYIPADENKFLEVFQEQQTSTTKRGRRRKRVECSGNMEFRSKKSRLVARVTRCMVDWIINSEEACTNLINLFGMWMENTIPTKYGEMVHFVDSLWYPFVQDGRDEASLANLLGSVDVSTQMFIFFPLVLRGYWGLFVLFNPMVQNLPKLDSEKMSLLYLDSFDTIVNPFECIVGLHRVVGHLANGCKDPKLALLLAHASTEIDFKCLKVPQQPNGCDCGFYVMAYCKHLIDGAIHGVEKFDEKWLTREWFAHNDVQDLKLGLHGWCAGIVKS